MRLVRGLIISLLLSFPVSAQTNLIPAEIYRDETWSGTNLVPATTIIHSNAVVRVAAGARIHMGSGATLIVYGKLLAAGTASEPIYFTRAVAGQRWRGIRFIHSGENRFEHSVFEYADSAGSHLDYYDDDCNAATPPPPRNYHEAIVAIASSVDFENCVFQNLPDSSGQGEGDAIAIISDDPQFPGEASAHINRCHFISIGQGIHTRFSHVLVENSFFTGHNGDNDDIDMYGESTPPPLIRSNLFLNPNHDDMINPTRCSAVIIGNVVSGGDDHGIVLRDESSPIVMNNFISNCESGGISVQNQCDALIANNTIVNCGRGIRLFDHDGRWDEPYCLSPGSGRVTVINTVIWDCDASLTLADSPFTGDRGSHVTVSYSNIEGGRGSASVSANSTLTWGEGNRDVDPQFDAEFRLLASSPLIDAGTNIVSEYSRPLDGDGDGTAAPDIGAHEFLLASADSNGDGIPDGWLDRFGLDPLDINAVSLDLDADGHTTAQEWFAATDPINAASVLQLEMPPASNVIQFQSSSNRIYTVEFTTNLLSRTWTALPKSSNYHGLFSLPILPANLDKFYRVKVELPSLP